MEDMLRPRYEYANETSVLPEDDSQNDSLAGVLKQKIRDKLWSAYNASKAEESITISKAKSQSIKSYYAESRAKVNAILESNSPEVRYADWNVPDGGTGCCDDHNGENEDDPLDKFARPGKGGAHQRVSASKNGHSFGKGGVRIRPHGVSAVLLEKERRDADVEARKLQHALRTNFIGEKK